MLKRYFILYILILSLLAACSNELSREQSPSQDIEVKHISSNQGSSQEPSNQAKDILSKNEDVTAVKAINNKDRMIIGVKVKHHKRFNLEKMKKKLTKKVEESFPDYKIELSTDKKIYLEIEKIEEKLQSNDLKSKELEKEIDRISKLSKEQT
ncbi:YhcN/YlaJ family sporulation lipoprotein [Oceanobacillus piezotolerans]|nr:YhcN/YlaJ family sporulation lipoprotein [Oceanobacillus piezotolerans]